MDNQPSFSHPIFQRTKQVTGLIPPPQATRQANPWLAAGLELLGYVGVLGIGRMYAGDWAGGITALMMWSATILASALFLGVGVTIAAVLFPFTCGMSVFIAFLGVIPLLPLLFVPLTSSLALFAQLQHRS